MPLPLADDESGSLTDEAALSFSGPLAVLNGLPRSSGAGIEGFEAAKSGLAVADSLSGVRMGAGVPIDGAFAAGMV